MPGKNAFYIAPIGEQGSDVRRRSDQILRHIVRPILDEFGFSIVRADELQEPGIITTQLIQRIIADDLVIADITGSNPNVFYELAIRHSVRKPYVQIIEKGERIPFDIAGVRTITLDHHDLDSVDTAKVDLRAQVSAAIAPNNKVESPISASFDVISLNQSSDPERRSMGDILASISDLKKMINALDERVEWQGQQLKGSDSISFRASGRISSIVHNSLQTVDRLQVAAKAIEHKTYSGWDSQAKADIQEISQEIAMLLEKLKDMLDAIPRYLEEHAQDRRRSGKALF